MLKPEITHKDKSVCSLKTHQTLTARAVAIPRRLSGLVKLPSTSVNHRSRTSALMAGLVLSMGISSFPTSLPQAANATESATLSTTSSQSTRPAAINSVQQLRNDISAMRAARGQRIAQIANRTDVNSLQVGSEASIQIVVPAPKTRVFKAVATASPTNPGDIEGELGNPSDRVPGRVTDTNLAFAWPADGKLTSKFGRRWGKMHKGIDIAGPVGTPIRAAADGVVVVAGWHSGGYGNLVEVRHSDGTITRYGHNSRVSVTLGQVVRQGQQVSEMGSTGHSTGSHLHFEIRPGGADAVNPIAHLPSNVS